MKITIRNYFLLVLLITTLSSCSQNREPVLSSSDTIIHQIGKASFYADKYHGRTTASGERFNQNERTAAHKTFKFGTRVKVTNIKNGKSIVVKINDRGPFIKSRIIDLSKSALSEIANQRLGVIEVVIKIIP